MYTYIYEEKVKISRLSLRETRDKRPLDKDKRPLVRDPNRSWCHRHTTSMIKLFLVAAHGSMGIGGSTLARWKALGLAYIRREIREKRSLDMSPDRSWCHRHTSVCCRRCPWSHGLRPKMLYTSVAMTPTPVRAPTQRLMSRVSSQSIHFQTPKMSTFFHDSAFHEIRHLVLSWLLRSSSSTPTCGVH